MEMVQNYRGQSRRMTIWVHCQEYSNLALKHTVTFTHPTRHRRRIKTMQSLRSLVPPALTSKAVEGTLAQVSRRLCGWLVVCLIGLRIPCAYSWQPPNTVARIERARGGWCGRAVRAAGGETGQSCTHKCIDLLLADMMLVCSICDRT